MSDHPSSAATTAGTAEPQPVAEAATTSDRELAEFRQYFPRASEQDFQRWKDRERRAVQLNDLVGKIPQEHPIGRNIRVELDRAIDALNFRKEYRITIAGQMGVGKSVLINALCGRNVLPFGLGMALTGTTFSVRLVPTAADGSFGVATPRYYRLEDFEQAVTSLEVTPLAETDGSGRLSLERTLNQLTAIRDRLSLTCPGCGRTLTKDETACPDCKALVAVDLDVLRTADHRSFLAEVIDLFQVGLAFRDKLDNRSTPTALKSPADVEKVKAFGREHGEGVSGATDQGRKYPETRAIRLIEYDLVPGFREADQFIRAVLIDTPGLGASIVGHARRLREELQRSHALIFVHWPVRPEANLHEVFPDLKNEPAELAARIFLVESRQEIKSVSGYDDSKHHLAAATAADHVFPGFAAAHPGHIQPRIRSTYGLIAQLLMQAGESGQAWLKEPALGKGDDAGAERRRTRYPLFADVRDGERLSYGEAILEARRDHPDLPDDEAVLQWSRIPELRRELVHFLGDTRLKADLVEGRTCYERALHGALDWVTRELTLRSPLPPRPYESPKAYGHRASGATGELLRRRLEQEADGIVQAVEKVYQEAMKPEGRCWSKLSTELFAVIRERQKDLDTRQSSKPLDVREDDPRTGSRWLVEAGWRQLGDLRDNITDTLAEDTRIASALLTQLEELLTAQHDIGGRLAAFAYRQPYAISIVAEYERQLQQLRDDFVRACQTSLKAAWLQQDVVVEVSKKTRLGNTHHIGGLESEPTSVREEGVASEAARIALTMFKARLENIRTEFGPSLMRIFGRYMDLCRREIESIVRRTASHHSAKLENGDYELARIMEEEREVDDEAERLFELWRDLWRLRELSDGEAVSLAAPGSAPAAEGRNGSAGAVSTAAAAGVETSAAAPAAVKEG